MQKANPTKKYTGYFVKRKKVIYLVSKQYIMKTKLLSYSGAATAFLFAGAQATNAQVVYSDIDPDIFMSGDADDFYLDANADGEYELRFEHMADVASPFFGCYGGVAPNYAYCLVSHVYDYTFGWTFGLPLEAGDPVPDGFNASPVAFNVQYIGAGFEYGIGPWVDGADHYFGFVFETPAGDGPFYGWVRLQGNDCGYTIKDFAYAPDGITAGMGVPEPCDIPAGLAATGVDAEKAKLSWDAVDGAETYTVQFREAGAIDWRIKTVDAPKNFVRLKTLDCATTYEWQVMADCAGGPSEFSAIQTFTTLSCRLSDVESENFTLYPNPAHDLLNVSYDDEITGQINLQVFDLTGNELIQKQITTETTPVDVSSLASGMYIMSITNAYGTTRVEFVKQ